MLWAVCVRMVSRGLYGCQASSWVTLHLIVWESSFDEPRADHYGFIASPRDPAVSSLSLLGLQIVMLVLEEQTQIGRPVRRTLYRRSRGSSQGFSFACVLCSYQRWYLSGKTLSHVDKQGGGLRAGNLVGCPDAAPFSFISSHFS